MTDDLHLTTTLPMALRTMAESEQPPVMDVERVLHEGRHSLKRRRMAALGGGTAVLAATGLAVGMLAPAGSLGHRTTAPAVTTPAPTAPTAMRTLAPAVGPHDPIVTRYQFGDLPEGMRADGGMDSPDHRNQYSWSVIADSASGFQLTLSQTTPEALRLQPGVKGGVAEHVPAVVPGATQAFWLGFGGGDIITSIPDGDYARLAWRLPGGEWLMMTASNLQDFPDWQEQTLKAAATVVRQDRTVPMPIKISGELLNRFQLGVASVVRAHGKTVSHLEFYTPGHPPVDIIAYEPGDDEIVKHLATFDATDTCKHSNGLTVCVNTTRVPPDALTAIGGPQALLDRITSLGTDPADWTQDVLE